VIWSGRVLHCPVVLVLDLERIGLSNLRFGCRECSNRLLAHATTSGRFNLWMDNIEGVSHCYSWQIFSCRFSPCKCNAYQWFSMCASDAIDMAAVVAV
jgi:hypothetical protein